MHLGREGVTIALRIITEGGGGLTEGLCNTKVYLLLTLYMSPVSPVFHAVVTVNIQKL